VKRVGSLARVLWSVTAAGSITGCGRLGFEERTTGDATTDVGVDVALSPVAQLEPNLALTTACGGTPGVFALPIANIGGAPLVIQDASATGGFVIATALPLTIAAGAAQELRVSPPAAVIGTDLGGATKLGVLSIVTNEPGAAAHDVALTATVIGANLEITDAAKMPVALTFSAASGLCPAPQSVFLRNTGNEVAIVDAGMASSFVMSGFSGGAIDPGGAMTVGVRVLTASACAGADQVTYTVTGTVCTTTPAVLQASYNITGASSCACS
jgi:hypothetical protein